MREIGRKYAFELKYCWDVFCGHFTINQNSEFWRVCFVEAGPTKVHVKWHNLSQQQKYVKYIYVSEYMSSV